MDYAFYRRLLFSDPACSSEAMALVNRYRFSIHQFERVHPAPAQFCGTLGATLRRQRIATGYSVSALALLCGVSKDVLLRLELGWFVPCGAEGADFLATVAVFCGFTVPEYQTLLRMAEAELRPSAMPSLMYAS